MLEEEWYRPIKTKRVFNDHYLEFENIEMKRFIIR